MYFYKAVVNTGIDCYLRKHSSAHEKMTDQSCYGMNIFVSSLNRMRGIIQTVAVKGISYCLSMKDIVRPGYEKYVMDRISLNHRHRS